MLGGLVGIGARGDMALSFVEAFDETLLGRAHELGQELQVPVHLRDDSPTPETFGADGVKLIVSPFGITLGFVNSKLGKPLILDFLSVTWRARFQQPLSRSHIFRRALGADLEGASLVDATAGFGQDAVLARTLGFKVTAVERSVAVAHVLSDALARAAREDESLRAQIEPLRVVNADAIEYLGDLSRAKAPDIIYIDPMFEKPKRSAKSPKEMQILQALLASDPGGETRLLDAALAAARSRVVVKRPLKARAGKPPSHSYKGQSIRYDVYISKASTL